MAYRILALKPKGVAAPYVISDLAEAFNDLGHTVSIVDLEQLVNQPTDMVKDLIISVNPDFAIMYGASGLIPLQKGPRVSHLLGELDIPFALLICDNPEIMLNELKWAKSSLMHIFIWDQVYAEELKTLGFSQVFPFALATNPRRFKPLTLSDEERLRFGVPVAFVGTLPSTASIEALRREIAADPLVDAILNLKRSNPELSCRQCIYDLMGKLDWKAVKELETFIESPVFSRFNLLVDRQLMYEHRLQVGRLLENSGITISIWGNDTWADVLQNRDTYRGTINYDTEVPLLYRAASIIVDVPSGQLLTSVNQRVFDVLAVGGFILTTFKKDLTRFFELDKEICCYSSHNELMEKLQYYLLHPEAREEISAAGQERVFREHTYHHRAGELLEIMGKALEKRRSNVPIIMSSYASPVVCNGCGHNEGEELFRFTFPYHGAKLDFVIVQCNNCGLIYNNPQWTPEIISSFYQEKYHRNYNIAQQTADILNIAIPRSDQELDLIEEIIPKGRLLDVGSGNGSFAATAATRGWEAWGVEPYQDALNMAKYFFGKCGAIFMQGTLRNIDLPPRNFDVVVFNDVLEHVHNPRADLLKAYELLVSNGLLVVAVPDAGSIYAMVQGCNWRHWDPPYHLYGFTRQTITRFLNETGFEIIKFKSNLMYVGQMLVFARKR